MSEYFHIFPVVTNLERLSLLPMNADTTRITASVPNIFENIAPISLIMSVSSLLAIRRRAVLPARRGCVFSAFTAIILYFSSFCKIYRDFLRVAGIRWRPKEPEREKQNAGKGIEKPGDLSRPIFLMQPLIDITNDVPFPSTG